ncbi:DUF3866 family protein [Halalkalibacter akibai]|uniref:DUF3866 family protein n=1 Tax=Halalkalibacter akibai (strain ATCC 43226 / DSM 21942 / CIP 109018 / JCM 9157 / 1139) TaxID=1236973 RepID=W4QXJ6_HALA3|nr:DUF3866 family protein [Halalkalibacter akibai]GAE36855.1 hypothetical protein JCM9157_4076 [Halalkalibacter akibai JCM 9157]
MYKQLKTKVLDIIFEDEEIQKLTTDKGAERAVLFKRLTKRVEAGFEIIVNVTATELQLGTGGWDIVRDILPLDDWGSNKIEGHIIKGRYTPIQHSVLAIESQESEYHPEFIESFSLVGKPVWLAELHSMVPLFYFVSQEIKAGSSCCVIFDDQAALPLTLSDQLRALHKEDHFHSITVGQAFGGQYEAITIASALQFAHKVLKADFILISVGPGVVGSGTRFGFSGMIMSHWSHTISALEGVPIWIPRMSTADVRERHMGISHHTLTPLCQFTFQKALLPLPYVNGIETEKLKQQIDQYRPFQANHDILFAEKDHVSSLIDCALRKAQLPIQTMGRKFEDDPLFFCAVAEAVRVGIGLTDSV